MPIDTSRVTAPSNQDPSPAEAVIPDKENAFMLYAVFCGDIPRTAAALGLEDEVVRMLAVENGWDRKLKPIIDLKNSTRAGDVERAINRALNFVDAHRLRAFLARVLKELTGMSYADLQSFIYPKLDERGSDGKVVIQKFSTRPLADLASAMEKCQTLTYMALNDTATERRERKDDGDDAEAAASDLHIKLAKAMNEAGAGSKSMHGHVLDAQIAIANERAPVPIIDLTKPQ